MPDETTPQETTETQATETKTEQTQQPEPKLSSYSVDGEVLQLTEEQKEQAVMLGIQAAKQRASKKEEAKPTDKKEETKEEQLAKKLEVLEGRLNESDNRATNAAIINQVSGMVDLSKIDDDFRDDIQNLVLTNIALNQSKGRQSDIKAIVKHYVDKHNKKMEKYKPITDAKQKIKDKEATEKGTPSGGTTGETAPAKHTKKSFRDGSLATSVLDFYKELSKKATE